MNKVILSGHLSTTIELRHTKDGKPVATFNLAVQRMNDGADFFPIIVWNKQAENVNKYCEKGSKILLEGRLATRTYDYKGEKRHVTEVIAEMIEFIGKPQKTQEKANKDPFEEFGDSIKTESQIGEQIKIEDTDLPF